MDKEELEDDTRLGGRGQKENEENRKKIRTKVVKEE